MKIVPSEVIDGLQLVKLDFFSDERGGFAEIFRNNWFKESDFDKFQINCSFSRKNVLRGLHYHLNQDDYWFVLQGKIKIALFDLRNRSKTFKNREILEFSASDFTGLWIPRGVAHGFLAMEDSILSYLVNNHYDNSDELGLFWDDPMLGIDWGINQPIISQRDQKNPGFKDIKLVF